MTSWMALLLVAAGSYLFRVAPLLLGARLRLPARTEAALRDAGAGCLMALLVPATASLSSGASTGPARLGVILAVLAAGCAAYLGRSMTVVVLAGVAAQQLTLAIATLG